MRSLLVSLILNVKSWTFVLTFTFPIMIFPPFLNSSPPSLSLGNSTVARLAGVHYKMLRHLPLCSLQYILYIYNIFRSRLRSHRQLFFPLENLVLKGLPLRSPIVPSTFVYQLFERMINVHFFWFQEHCSLSLFPIWLYKYFASLTDILVDMKMYLYRMTLPGDNFCLAQMHSFDLRGNLRLFLQGFLSRRSIQVRVGAAFSKSIQQYEGIPQGSALSTKVLVALNGLHSLQCFLSPLC